jgi:hypothetical protein
VDHDAGSMELATAWRTQVRAANLSLISGINWDEPRETPDSLRVLRYWFLLPWTGKFGICAYSDKVECRSSRHSVEDSSLGKKLVES